MSQRQAMPRALRSAHPLGPFLYRAPPDDTRSVKFAALAALAGIVAVFIVCRWMNPPMAGFGAHEQLGLAPCPMPLLFGFPCPTCGMTTALAHFAHGRPLASFHTQPAGFLVALGLLAIGYWSVDALLTGRPWKVNWYRVQPVYVAILAAVVLLAGWLYKLVTFAAPG